MKDLIIYYDNPSEPSDMYLKMIQMDAAEKNVNCEVLNAYEDVMEKIRGNERNYAILPLLPLTDNRIVEFMKSFPCMDIDNVSQTDHVESATATGIYNHIVERCPRRSTVIGVIGRGVVGKSLIKQLINYGYTVLEINSQTLPIHRDNLLPICDVIVGLSSKDKILNEDNKYHISNLRTICDCYVNEMEQLGTYEPWFIDAGYNFDFKDRKSVSKCGKWTREVLFSRL